MMDCETVVTSLGRNGASVIICACELCTANEVELRAKLKFAFVW